MVWFACPRSRITSTARTKQTNKYSKEEGTLIYFSMRSWIAVLTAEIEKLLRSYALAQGKPKYNE